MIDGPVQGSVADRLVQLMLGQVHWDDEGHRVRAPGQHRIIWETTNLSDASPALLASAAVCAVHVSIINQPALGLHALDSMQATCPLLDMVGTLSHAAQTNVTMLMNLQAQDCHCHAGCLCASVEAKHLSNHTFPRTE